MQEPKLSYEIIHVFRIIKINIVFFIFVLPMCFITLVISICCLPLDVLLTIMPNNNYCFKIYISLMKTIYALINWLSVSIDYANQKKLDDIENDY